MQNNLYNYGYEHTAIRAFMLDGANGTVCENALIAIKNLESAIRHRKTINKTEWEAIKMIAQCAEELFNSAWDKPQDDKPHLPRDLREGLKREIVDAMLARNCTRFVVTDTHITDKDGKVWGYDENNRLYRVC